MILKLHLKRNSALYVYAGIIIIALLLLILSLKRVALNYGVETDFLGGFVPEAKRIIQGSSLGVAFHPPFYSFVLAVFNLLFNDWVKAGWFLSIASSIIVLFSCFYFFRIKYGDAAAIGSILFLIISVLFTSFSITASSDMFFLAIYFAALSVIASTETKFSLLKLFISGLLISLSILTRSNGVAAGGFLLFFIPIFQKAKINFLKYFAVILFGFLIPIIGWISYANYSNSPLWVTSNYENLALSYYAADRDSLKGEERLKAAENFSSIWEVFTKDPLRIAKIYLNDLILNSRNFLTDDRLISFPLSLLILPGLFFFLLFNFNRFNQIILINLIGMFLILNFMPYQPRFYMFLVPFSGAAISLFLLHIYRNIINRPLKIFVASFFVFYASIFVGSNYARLNYFLNQAAWDALAAAKIIKELSISDNDVVIARKLHLSFYCGLKSRGFPNVESLQELRAAIRKVSINLPTDAKIFLFYGQMEKRHRSKLEKLSSKSTVISWLKPIAYGDENGGWTLYQVISSEI